MAGSSNKALLLIAVAALSCVSLSVAFHTPTHVTSSLALRPFQNAALCRAASPRSSSSPASSPTMGLRDNLKKFAAGVAAAFTVGFVPSRAMAADVVAPEPQGTEEAAGQNQAPMALPSQVSHQKRLAAGGQGPVVTTVKKIAGDKRLYMVLGAGAAGAAGYSLVQNKAKQENEKARSFLSSNSGINIDASILDEKRLNRPGARKFKYSGGVAPKFGEYREPPKKMMQGLEDKYVFNRNEDTPMTDEDEDIMADNATLDLFKKKADGSATRSGGDVSNTNGDTVQKVGDLDVEVVGEGEGPRTAAQRELESELQGLDGMEMDDMLRQVMKGSGEDPTGMDPQMMAAALPALQEQLSELMKGGISADEIGEVKASFQEMGIDLEDMFTKIDEMEAAGLSDAVGPEGLQFFKTLRKIMDSA